MKSCKWTGFVSVAGQIQSVKLIFGWSADGVFGGTGTNDFLIQHSTDGGSNWTNAVSRTNIDSPSSNANETVNLDVTQDLTQVQVRDLIRSITNPSNTVTASVSNIRIEVVTANRRPMGMM